MRVLKSFFVLATVLGTLFSCEKVSDEELSKITVKLIKKGSEKVAEGLAATLEYDVVLSESLSKDVALEFGLVNPKDSLWITRIFLR